MNNHERRLEISGQDRAKEERKESRDDKRENLERGGKKGKEDGKEKKEKRNEVSALSMHSTRLLFATNARDCWKKVAILYFCFIPPFPSHYLLLVSVFPSPVFSRH